MARGNVGMLVVTTVTCLLSVGPAWAQHDAGLGSRALGMAGAFTAVADDASAVYWNPAGSATGALASVVADWSVHDSAGLDDDRNAPAVRGSGTLVALTVPVIGAGYYRLASSGVGETRLQAGPADGLEPVRSGAGWVTDHFALTLAHTLVDGVHVGVALKAVRGQAMATEFTGPSAEGADGALDRVDDLVDGAGANVRFDLDVGVMVDRRTYRVAFSARNLTEPAFGTDTQGVDLRLQRTARVGGALLPKDWFVVAVDADLATQTGVDGRWRALAGGTEVWARSRRLAVRGGVSVQTVDELRPSASVGATVVVGKGLSVDGRVTGGGSGAGQGWSVGARFTY